MKRIIICLFLLSAVMPNLAAKPKAKHVLMIAIDGWASWAFQQADHVPNMHNLMENGCYTMKKRSMLPSASAINWATTFMGISTEMHGYTQWNSRKPEIPPVEVNRRGICPTIYSIIREQKPTVETGCICDWDVIPYLIDSTTVSYHEYTLSPGNACEPLTQKAISYIKAKKPDFFTVYYAGLDETGHIKGWGTPEYFAFMQRIDTCIGQLVQALKDAGIYDDTVIMITSDHGGKDKGHGGLSLEEMLTPYVICGKNVKKGGEFKEVMMQFDVPATVAYILGVTPPQSWIGRPVKQVFK